jgi:hypothetical protein
MKPRRIACVRSRFELGTSRAKLLYFMRYSNVYLLLSIEVIPHPPSVPLANVPQTHNLKRGDDLEGAGRRGGRVCLQDVWCVMMWTVLLFVWQRAGSRGELLVTRYCPAVFVKCGELPG